MSKCSVISVPVVSPVRRVPRVSIVFDVTNPRSRSRTHQSFAKDADINNVMAKFRLTGVLGDPNLSSARRAQFGDFSDITDYPTMVNRIKQAQADFLTLPSEVRAKFDNLVENCIEFISDPKNADEAVTLGLLPPTAAIVTKAVLDGAPKPKAKEPTPVTPAS